MLQVTDDKDAPKAEEDHEKTEKADVKPLETQKADSKKNDVPIIKSEEQIEAEKTTRQHKNAKDRK